MLKNRIARIVGAGAVMILPLAGATALAAGPATASNGATGITCSKVVGTINLTANTEVIKFKNCTGNTGTLHKGKSTGPVTPIPTSGTIKWSNGLHTTFSQSTTAGSGCPSPDLTEVLSGTVTADQTGSTAVGAAVSATLCYNPTAGVTPNLTNESGTSFVIAP